MTTRRSLLAAAALVALLPLAGCMTADVLPVAGDGSDQTQATLSAINALRTQKGLKPLVADPTAVAAALSQAGRMAKAGKMSHLIGFNDSFLGRMKGQKVSLPAAENIAAGQADAAKAYDAWLKSPKHLENMLGPDYRGLGVAVMRNPASGNRPYWAMVLSAG